MDHIIENLQKQLNAAKEKIKEQKEEIDKLKLIRAASIKWIDETIDASIFSMITEGSMSVQSLNDRLKILQAIICNE